ncbi:MAG: glycosyl transferase, partial [Brachybacterium sp.]|nr:glycosyl transferase [Brachybacterium sp.]
MSAPSLRIAAVSLHTSPLEDPGGADAGGMNVVVLSQSHDLPRLGHRVDLF